MKAHGRREAAVESKLQLAQVDPAIGPLVNAVLDQRPKPGPVEYTNQDSQFEEENQKPKNATASLPTTGS